MTFFGLINTIKQARATLTGWGEYKRQTGRWPLLSITVHTLYFGLLLAIITSLVWFSATHSWSDSRLGWFAFIALIPFVFFWSWIEDKCKLNDLRNRRRLVKNVKS
jgi:hypothetical protein